MVTHAGSRVFVQWSGSGRPRAMCCSNGLRFSLSTWRQCQGKRQDGLIALVALSSRDPYDVISTG